MRLQFVDRIERLRTVATQQLSVSTVELALMLSGEES
jgi:hypothetical protein